jgi:thiamine kinase-like enzyme
LRQQLCHRVRSVPENGRVPRLSAEEEGADPDGYGEVQKEAEIVRAALSERPAALRPYHCDPLAENFLDTGARIFIIDWEYAGNNDPCGTSATSPSRRVSAPTGCRLLRAYFGGEPPAAQVGRMVMYKAMCDLLWTLWGVIQVANEIRSTTSGPMPSSASSGARP